MNLQFRKGDLLAMGLVAALAILVALLFLSPGGQPAQVQIYQDAQLIKTLSLQEETSITVTGKYTNVITVKDGEVCISASDCPGEDCVHSGAIHASGRSIVCLPNAVEVRVVNAASDVDFVVG